MNRGMPLTVLLLASTLGCWGSLPSPASAQGEDERGSSPGSASTDLDRSPLEAHAWEDRPIVVFAPDASDESFRRQMEIFRAHRSGLAERRNVVYRVFDDETGEGPVGPLEAGDVRALRSRFEPEGAFTAVLVGLDQTEKLRVDEPLASDRLFETIDAMPMRKRELRREE